LSAIFLEPAKSFAHISSLVLDLGTFHPFEAQSILNLTGFLSILHALQGLECLILSTHPSLISLDFTPGHEILDLFCCESLKRLPFRMNMKVCRAIIPENRLMTLREVTFSYDFPDSTSTGVYLRHMIKEYAEEWKEASPLLFTWFLYNYSSSANCSSRSVRSNTPIVCPLIPSFYYLNGYHAYCQQRMTSQNPRSVESPQLKRTQYISTDRRGY